MLGRIWRRIRAATDQLVQTTARILPEATAGVPYSLQLTYAGALPNETIVFSLAAGPSLPPGLSLSADGLISGTVPSDFSGTAVTYEFLIEATRA